MRSSSLSLYSCCSRFSRLLRKMLWPTCLLSAYKPTKTGQDGGMKWVQRGRGMQYHTDTLL